MVNFFADLPQIWHILKFSKIFSVHPISNKKICPGILRNHAFYKLEDICKDFQNFEITDTPSFSADLPQTWHILTFSKTSLNRLYQKIILPPTNFGKTSFFTN